MPVMPVQSSNQNFNTDRFEENLVYLDDYESLPAEMQLNKATTGYEVEQLKNLGIYYLQLRNMPKRKFPLPLQLMTRWTVTFEG
ncbi:8161_t:CDS:2 [Diversispora eburnea]|uniref:8161_t:CDS:1 n=1 Tax=Diversispora eburnea TaxID=1213867 RepID=A0A9N8VE28_9GLOM|nr:8161_t:CDS:2 [Diversispora eburnea]